MRWVALFLLAGVLAAEDGKGESRVSLSVADEAAAFTGAATGVPQTTNLFLVQPSFSYRAGQRWRASASLALFANTNGETHGRARVKEAYAGYTAGDFDFTAGKKILKWGTGYAFTPTGVLDPPRDPTDPTDRLNLNSGRELASVDWIRGRHALTAAWASGGLLDTHRPGLTETTALRYNTMVEGFDTAVIYAHDRGRDNFYGANFTRVVGEAIEVHGELAHRTGTAALIGGKYMTHSGISTIAEFYSPESPRRGQYVYISVSKSRLRELPGWKHWDVGVSMLMNTTDRSRVAILDVTRRLGDHCSLTARAETPGGKKWRSEYGMLPYSSRLSLGFRYQI